MVHISGDVPEFALLLEARLNAARGQSKGILKASESERRKESLLWERRKGRRLEIIVFVVWIGSVSNRLGSGIPRH